MSITTPTEPGPPAGDDLVEVRLGHRPLGDVLSVTVPAEGRGTVLREELDERTLVEWVRGDDGQLRFHGLEVLGARALGLTAGGRAAVPAPLQAPIHDLVDPGHRHHHHPSAHRPSGPATVREAVVRLPARHLVPPPGRADPDPLTPTVAGTR